MEEEDGDPWWRWPFVVALLVLVLLIVYWLERWSRTFT